MSFVAGIAIFVGVIIGLSVIGAIMVRKNPDTKWEAEEDHPMIGHGTNDF